MDAPIASSGQSSPVVQDIVPVCVPDNGFGSSGWIRSTIDRILASGLRSRILHDIVALRSGDPGTFRRMCRAICEARTGATGVICVIFHAKPEFEHLHVLHDCTWHSSACRCKWLEEVRSFIRPRNPRRCIRSTDFFNEEVEIRNASRKHLENILKYFFEKGGSEAFLEIGGRVQRPISSGLASSPWFTIPQSSGSGEMEGSDCHGEAVDFSDYDSENRETLQESSSSDHRTPRRKRQKTNLDYEKLRREIEKKMTLETRILNFCKMFPCCPVNDLCNLKAWTEQADLQFIRRNNPSYKSALEVFSLNLCRKSTRCFQEMYSDPNCQPVFSAPRGEITDYYLDKENTLKYVSELLEYQCRDVKDFLQTLRNVLDRQILKKNTIQVTSPPSAGKTWFFDFVSAFYINRGNLKNFNRYSSFPFEDCHNRRIIMWNEPNASPEHIDTLKMLFGGDDVAAAKKYEGDVNITRTPLIVTTNEPFYPRNEALNHRRFMYDWKAAPFLKQVLKKPHPLYWPDLLDKYNIEY